MSQDIYNIDKLLTTPIIGNAMSDHYLLNGLPLIILDMSCPEEIRRQAWDKLNEVIGESDPFGGEVYQLFLSLEIDERGKLSFK